MDRSEIADREKLYKCESDLTGYTRNQNNMENNGNISDTLTPVRSLRARSNR